MTDEAPPALQSVLDFVNTYDAEDRSDAIDTPAKLDAWLTSKGLGTGGRVTKAHVAEASALRNTLMTALLANHGDQSAAAPPAPSISSVPLELVITADGTAALQPAGSGITPALGHIVAAIPAAVADGSWARMKICPNDACLMAFYDRSKNRSRRWCSMEVCGNREKTQAFRERQRADEPVR